MALKVVLMNVVTFLDLNINGPRLDDNNQCTYCEKSNVEDDF